MEAIQTKNVKNLPIPLHPDDWPRGINPSAPTILVQGDQSPKTLFGKVKFVERTKFNLPLPNQLVQGDHSPYTKSVGGLKDFFQLILALQAKFSGIDPPGLG